jgi:hypothetical protein
MYYQAATLAIYFSFFIQLIILRMSVTAKKKNGWKLLCITRQLNDNLVLFVLILLFSFAESWILDAEDAPFWHFWRITMIPHCVSYFIRWILSASSDLYTRPLMAPPVPTFDFKIFCKTPTAALSKEDLRLNGILNSLTCADVKIPSTHYCVDIKIHRIRELT